MGYHDIFHNFFHGGQSSISGANYHFEGDAFFSYATTIALKAHGDEGAEWLLVSANSMSSFTGRHLNYLLRACPYDNYIRIPLERGDVVRDLRDVAVLWSRYARSMDGCPFSKAEDRMKFEWVHDSFKIFLKYFKKQLEPYAEYLGRATEILAGCRRRCEERDAKLKAQRERLASRTDAEIEAAREKRRLAEERRQKRIEEQTKAIMAIPYLQRVRLMFSYWGKNERPGNIPAASWEMAMQKMRCSGEQRAFSFMWPEGEGVRTSQRVYVPSDDVKKAILLHVRTRHVLGAKIGGFTLVDIDDKAVRVGCHLIPMENVKAMAEYYGIEWK